MIDYSNQSLMLAKLIQGVDERIFWKEQMQRYAMLAHTELIHTRQDAIQASKVTACDSRMHRKKKSLELKEMMLMAVPT